VGFDLVCLASVYHKPKKMSLEWAEQPPRAEKRFALALPGEGLPGSTAAALMLLVPRVERWLVSVRADLANDVVVTVYALERNDGTPLDDCAA